MKLQYILDSTGEATGVFTPINEWNELKRKFRGIEQEEKNIPEWHKNLVRERLEDYKRDPDSAMYFDSSLDEIEKNL